MLLGATISRTLILRTPLLSEFGSKPYKVVPCLSYPKDQSHRFYHQSAALSSPLPLAHSHPHQSRSHGSHHEEVTRASLEKDGLGFEQEAP